MNSTASSGTLPGESLPALVNFERLEANVAHLAPAARLAAFHEMSPWRQAEAWLDLRLRIDHFRSDDFEAEWEMAA